MIPSILDQIRVVRRAPARFKGARLCLFGTADAVGWKTWIGEAAPAWQKTQLMPSPRETMHFIASEGPIWMVRPKPAPPATSHHGQLEDSSYSFFRDAVGAQWPAIKSMGLENVLIEMDGLSQDQILGALVGLDLAQYSFRPKAGKSATPDILLVTHGSHVSPGLLKEARVRGRAVNTARHLVNRPPNDLNPSSFAETARKHLKGPGLKIDVWNHQRLAKEKMNLHLAVGRGAEHPPCLVHISYRPAGAKGRKPVAFVGKGITFDSGGLDIKPSSGMRLMKKDMGGAAAVFAVMQWAVESRYPAPLDAYLALAENAVDAKAFHPSDVIEARNGAMVEIDNTDAEGRLVLADALDVACTQTGSNDPEVVIDVATLTGAIKVALGADIAGLFSNEDGLAESLALAGQQAGDLSWRMPLVERYWSSLNSPFADFKNSADGFGGAITAALFLSRFVHRKPWAHLDIYAWSDKSQGAITGSGGSGQAVQALIEWLENRV